MRRPVLFVIIELAVFVVAEGANAYNLAGIPLPNRIAAGLAIAAFVALGFVTGGSPRTKSVLLGVNAVFLGLIASFTGVAVIIAVLLPVRCLELKPRARTAFIVSTVFAALAFATALYVGVSVEHRPAEPLAAPVLLPLYALILTLVIVANDLRISRASLAAANAETALRAERWEEVATLAERYRIGRELQDEVGRGLQEIGEQLERALSEGDADPQGAKAFIFRAQRTAAFTLAALRRTVSTMRADSLARGDLAASLRDLCKAFSTAGRLPLITDIDNVAVSDPVVIARAERIAREALINVARHSEASSIKVSFGIKDDRLEILIEDNGIGFDPKTTKAGTGLAVMRDRANLMGADCAIESIPGEGTSIRVTLPVPNV